LDRFIVTSAGRFGRHLVLGSRTGGLAVYDPEKCDEPTCTWLPAAAGDAVTSLLNIPNSMNDINSGYVLMTSRDGTYSIFSLADSISMVHQGMPPFGPMIEAAWFSGTDLILYGFKSKNFIVWNETQQYEISSIECGGAHRSYAYSPVTGRDGAGYFVYTKASKLYLHSQARPSHQIIKPGGHGREIKACAVSPDGLIATGAEDTAIRIWRYQDDGSPVEKQFNCLAVVHKHTTGIQHLQWHGASYLFSSGGNEEFYIWAVQLIPAFGIGLVCEASCPDQSEERDLRIMGFDVSSLSVSDGSETLLITLAYSDSTVRCYTYSKAERFDLVARGQYTSSCLTQLRHLRIGQELFFLTAGTDGHLTVWKTILPSGSKEATASGLHHSTMSESERILPCQERGQASQLVMLSNHRLHQSSIKSLDIATKDNEIIVATGGDDNALGVTIYEVNNLVRKSRNVLIRSAHAAAITGLSFVSNSACEKSGEMRIVTSGNDQRVKEWALCICSPDQANHKLDMSKVGDVFTSVADVGDLAILSGTCDPDSKKVLVLGNGMEVYEVCLFVE
jgi:WD40 repeat protein